MANDNHGDDRPGETRAQKKFRLQTVVDMAANYIESLDATWAENRRMAVEARNVAKSRLRQFEAETAADDD